MAGTFEEKVIMETQVSPTEAIDRIKQELSRRRISIRTSSVSSIPATGPVVVVVNRLFGEPDPYSVLSVILELRSDVVVFGHEDLIEVNELHGIVHCLLDFKNGTALPEALEAVIKAGGLAVLFPSKEGNSSRLLGGLVLDKRWDTETVSALQDLNCPIVPMYLHTEAYVKLIHSARFSFDRLTAYYDQLTNREKHVDVQVGPLIDAAVWHRFSSDAQLSRYLRARLYALGSAVEPDLFFVPKGIKERIGITVEQVPIAKAGDMDQVRGELARLTPITTQAEYKVYLAEAREIPHALKEIGRLRELAFRQVGEGSGRERDLDEYDLHYLQLILWDEEKGTIAGGYRLGLGDAVMARFGRKGFYIRSLFKLDKGMNPYLEQCIELGRSFVSPDHQKARLPLFMLWRGILGVLQQRPQVRYLIGPVSISNSYSQVSQELIVSYIRKYHWDAQLAQYVRPRKAFKPSKVTDVDVDALLEAEGNEISAVDRLIAEIEPGHQRMPVLVKRYMAQEARIIGFNVDPKFSGALDGLMVLDVRKIPETTLTNLQRELS